MKLIRDKSGVSLMFVLASMMLLLVIGVSAIVAAGLNVGAGAAQHDRTQLELYSSSMERTIKAAFEREETVGANLVDAQTLGGQLLSRLIADSDVFYQNALGQPAVASGAVIIDVNETIELAPGGTPITLPDGIDATYTMRITGQLFVFVNTFQRNETVPVFIGVDGDGNDIYHPVEVFATPMTATVTGDFIIELLTVYNPVSGLHGVPLSFSSETTYRLDNLILTEGDFAEDKKTLPELDELMLSNQVVWTVIRYESFG